MPRSTAYQSAKSRHHMKDKKVDVLVSKSAQDAEGNFRSFYVPITPKPVWAYFRQLGGVVNFSAMSYRMDEENVFYVNWNEALANGSANYVIYRGKAYEVQRIDTYEGYKRDVALYCSTAKLNFDMSKVKPYGYGETA